MDFLSPIKIDEYSSRLRENPQEALTILNEIFAIQSLLLESNLLRLLKKLIEYTGPEGIAVIENNLSKLQLSHSNYEANDLANTLLQYYPSNQQLIKVLLNWRLELVKNSSIQKVIKIENADDIGFYQAVVTKAINSPDIDDHIISDLIVFLGANSPTQIYPLLSSLETNVVAKLNLTDLCRYLIENGHADIFVHAEQLLATSHSDHDKIIKYLQNTFPQKRVEMIFSYLKNVNPGSYLLPESILNDFVQNLNSQEFVEFIKLCDSYWQQQLYPSRFVTALVINKNLDLSLFATSQYSIRLYQSVIDNCSRIVEIWQSNTNAFDLYSF